MRINKCPSANCGGASLFTENLKAEKTAGVEKMETELPTREEVLLYGKNIGADYAADFYDFSARNEWRDRNGRALMDWRRALKAYERRAANA